MISARRQDAASALEQDDNLCVCLRVFAYVVLRCHQKGGAIFLFGSVQQQFWVPGGSQTRPASQSWERRARDS